MVTYQEGEGVGWCQLISMQKLHMPSEHQFNHIGEGNFDFKPGHMELNLAPTLQSSKSRNPS